MNYPEAYGNYACNGILFNHESKRRGETFVTRKVTRGLANIAQGNGVRQTPNGHEARSGNQGDPLGTRQCADARNRCWASVLLHNGV